MGSTWPNLGPRCAPNSLTLLNIGPTKSQREREREGERQRDRETRPHQVSKERERERETETERRRERGPSPAHTQTQIGRRPAVRRKPHKSGRRPRARVLAGGLRLVTERYIRSRPLPPTLLLDRAYTPCRPPPDLRLNPVDRFICILRRMFKKCSKTSFFYSVSWPPADMTFA